MEKYEESRKNALKNLSIADHMLTMTYPVVQDPKILFVVSENLFLALTNILGALLYFERLYKRIPPFHENFESKFNMFKMRCVEKYNIEKEYLSFILEMKEIINENKRSPITFSRKHKYVICSEEYDLKTISEKDIKKNLEKAKLFIHKICLIIEKNERFAGKCKRRTEKD
ncbi:MAG: hypothetical protein KKF44_08580 [Nanoarchaeota archaeon]|nr:hypothetical protein [Nanoarchaeota archaeon]